MIKPGNIYKRGKSIYINAKELELLLEMFSTDISFSANDNKVKEKEAIFNKLLRIERPPIRRH